LLTLADIASRVGVALRGDGSIPIHGLATLGSARSGHLSFLANSRYRQQLSTTRASAVIIAPDDLERCPVAALVSDNPLLTYARVAVLFECTTTPRRGVHATAWVSDEARVAEDTWIGPHSTVEAEAIVESGVFIGPHCVVGAGAVVGAGSCLRASVTLCHGVHLGRRVLIHPGAVVGSDGFGLARDRHRWVKIPQLGGVRVGDDVEIGANTTIDRGALDDTVIEDGVKLDNQVQVAHNVCIGAHTAVAGCVGIAGSARIGRYCNLAGGVGIAGHLELADHVTVTGMSLVSRSLTRAGTYSSGLPVQPNRLWNRIGARLRQLDEFARRLTALEKKITVEPSDE